MNELLNKSIYDTMQHKNTVYCIISTVIKKLVERQFDHDNSKLESPELEIFAEYGPKLKDTTYGSNKYDTYLQEMKIALQHHYANNRHHPEHFQEGVKNMTLIDLVEMFCDWYAASLRHDDGNIYKSIEINKDRFNMSDDLSQIFKNTIKAIQEIKK